jgi:hypothetical protein
MLSEETKPLHRTTFLEVAICTNGQTMAQILLVASLVIDIFGMSTEAIRHSRRRYPK